MLLSKVEPNHEETWLIEKSQILAIQDNNRLASLNCLRDVYEELYDVDQTLVISHLLKLLHQFINIKDVLKAEKHIRALLTLKPIKSKWHLREFFSKEVMELLDHLESNLWIFDGKLTG